MQTGSTPELLLERARECRFCQDDLRALQSELPDDDEQLDHLLSKAVSGRDDTAFTHLLIAALDLGRPVDARHIAGGAVLLPDPSLLSAVAMRCRGNVADAMVEAVRRGGMGNEREAAALLIGGKWSKERGDPTVSPELVARARILSRQAGENPIVWMLLRGLADLIEDENLASTLGGDDTEAWSSAERELAEDFLKHGDDPVFELVPERPERYQVSGYTVRRAVPKVGRNDACPCGSGKKYKRCCADKDQERLSHSSDVPGVTVEELRRSPENYLRVDRLLDMRSYELARLDPARVSQDMRSLLVQRLLVYEELEAAVSFFETLGLGPDLEDCWYDTVSLVTHESRRDLLERLVAVQKKSEVPAAPLDLGARLLLAGEEDQPLEMIEAAVQESLRTDDVSKIVDMSYDLLHSRTPALGILVARGVLPICDPFDASMLFEELLTIRDELYLAPTDPLEETLDRIFLHDASGDYEQSEASKQARELLESKRAEASALRIQLAKLHTELEQRRAETAKEPEQTKAEAQPVDRAIDPMVSELRGKIESLKGELKQHHLERNQLRREVRAAHKNLETLRETQAQSNAGKTADPVEAQTDAEEESMFVAEQFLGSQPLRNPSYPKRFREQLDAVPEPVARETIRLVGRLGAGDAAAFHGTKRLKRRHEVLRQRVGRQHRLLFRLHEKILEVVALIHRRNLERTIKRLG